jgi:hypothetical protein
MILQVKVVDLSKISVFEELGSDTGGFSQPIQQNANMALGRNLVSSAYQSLRQVCVEKYDQPST